MITVPAPAKVNLTLEVISRRDDGYHEIDSIVQTVGLCDVLRFEAADDLTLNSRMPRWSAAKSLSFRAATRLREVTGCSQGARISIEKNIPLRAGLGGESSDAAATLIGLNRLWNLKLSGQALTKIAAELGSDVPFFLYGGTARIRGRGEIVTPLPASPQGWVVLLVPAVDIPPDKTARMYSLVRPEHYGDGTATHRLAARLERGEEIDDGLLYNVFDDVAADYFGLGTWRRRFGSSEAERVHVAGSGPGLFTLLPDKQRAERVYAALRGRGLGVYLAPLLRLDDRGDAVT
jgi:4-diphosphocytidyl-2-C-methyl-D-erythritol kinase